MCVCNCNDSKYEIIVNDNFDTYICTINFKSITNVCRFLEEANLNSSRIDVIRKSDSKLLDTDILLSIWLNDFQKCEV